VILGAYGVVGSGAALAFLRDGWTVIAVGRDETKLTELKNCLAAKHAGIGDRLELVQGQFNSDMHTAKVYDAVKKAIGGDGTFHHVMSILGFVTTSDAPPTETPSEKIMHMIEREFMPNYRAAMAFLNPIKSVPGASYTIMSGGFAHGVQIPAAWPATIKNSMINTFLLTLADETKTDPVRVNVACLHFAVAAFGGTKNQLGMDAKADTERLGDVFVNIAKSPAKKGEVICLENINQALSLNKSLAEKISEGVHKTGVAMGLVEPTAEDRLRTGAAKATSATSATRPSVM